MALKIKAGENSHSRKSSGNVLDGFVHSTVKRTRWLVRYLGRQAWLGATDVGTKLKGKLLKAYHFQASVLKICDGYTRRPETSSLPLNTIPKQDKTPNPIGLLREISDVAVKCLLSSTRIR